MFFASQRSITQTICTSKKKWRSIFDWIWWSKGAKGRHINSLAKARALEKSFRMFLARKLLLKSAFNHICWRIHCCRNKMMLFHQINLCTRWHAGRQIETERISQDVQWVNLLTYFLHRVLQVFMSVTGNGNTIENLFSFSWISIRRRRSECGQTITSHKVADVKKRRKQWNAWNSNRSPTVREAFEIYISVWNELIFRLLCCVWVRSVQKTRRPSSHLFYFLARAQAIKPLNFFTVSEHFWALAALQNIFFVFAKWVGKMPRARINSTRKLMCKLAHSIN